MFNNLYYEKGPCPHTNAQCRVFCKCRSVRQKKTLDLRPLVEKLKNGRAYGADVETKDVNDSVKQGAVHKISRSRLFRTNSLARELRKLKIAFSFFQRDTIHFSLNVSDFAHTEVYVSATKEQYSVKKQFFKWNSWAFDETIESIDITGKDLLSVLVYLGELPEKFQPENATVIL